jgi:hypothetical protein
LDDADLLINNNGVLAGISFDELADEISGLLGPGGVIISTTPPDNPQEGQQWWNPDEGETFIWTGSEWVEANCCECPPGPAGPAGPEGPQGPPGIPLPLVISIQTFNASGTYVPSPGLQYAIVECVGGGGGGGNTGSVGSPAVAGGGGSGAYARRAVSSFQIGASQPITVGAGGASASNGGATSFGSLCVAAGGSGAPTFSLDQSIPSASGGLASASVGDVTINGRSGVGPVYANTGSAGRWATSFGADSVFGAGGVGPSLSWPASGTMNQAGSNGNVGGGGSGGMRLGTGTTNQLGGSGGNGIVIVTEYRVVG